MVKKIKIERTHNLSIFKRNSLEIHPAFSTDSSNRKKQSIHKNREIAKYTKKIAHVCTSFEALAEEQSRVNTRRRRGDDSLGARASDWQNKPRRNWIGQKRRIDGEKRGPASGSAGRSWRGHNRSLQDKQHLKQYKRHYIMSSPRGARLGHVARR